MFFALFLCVHIFSSARISADTFTGDRKRENFKPNSNRNRIAELEEQVANLQDIVGLRNNGTIWNQSGIDSYLDPAPRDCQELLQRGYTENGVYTVSPDGRCPFSVYCDMTDGGWTMIQRRQFGSVDFRRNWTEYARGFGDIDGEHWLGLDKIYRLTYGGNQIKFTFLTYDFEVHYSYYPSFIVHDVMSGYKMNVNPHGFQGTIPELFSYHDDMPFSTYDRDQDQFSSSCSEEYGGGGGWWYRSCYRLGALNGEYGERNLAGMRIWDMGDKYVLNSAIKIKPRVGMC